MFQGLVYLGISGIFNVTHLRPLHEQPNTICYDINELITVSPSKVLVCCCFRTREKGVLAPL